MPEMVFRVIFFDEISTFTLGSLAHLFSCPAI
jgi:hypothetical protein